MPGTEPTHHPVDVERARLFALLGQLLGGAPDAALLHRLALPHHAPGEVGAAYAALATAAALATPEGVQREFACLFAGDGQGQVQPYASRHGGGAGDGLLAELKRLGVERAEGVAEPEDHIAFICETYAGLLAGVFGTPAEEAARFFARHLEPWAARCFGDIESAEAAVFYRAVGRLGRAAIGAAIAPPG